MDNITDPVLEKRFLEEECFRNIVLPLVDEMLSSTLEHVINCDGDFWKGFLNGCAELDRGYDCSGVARFFNEQTSLPNASGDELIRRLLPKKLASALQAKNVTIEW